MFLVPLSQGLHAMIDIEDAPLVLPFKWTAQRSKQTFYAYRWDRTSGKARKVYLHRAVMGEPECLVDHRDGNGLDCRRDNLRPADHALSAHNVRRSHTSQHRGVSRDKSGKWRAQIVINKRRFYLGLFADESEAAAAYNSAAAVAYGG